MNGESMSLAQVVYNISTDDEFAALWSIDPETALADKNLRLSWEEKAFLKSGLMNGNHPENRKVRLLELALIHRGWM
ncbi:MAG: hypothetical protein ACK2U3_01305 [Anaerolineales bacterium]